MSEFWSDDVVSRVPSVLVFACVHERDPPCAGTKNAPTTSLSRARACFFVFFEVVIVTRWGLITFGPRAYVNQY